MPFDIDAIAADLVDDGDRHDVEDGGDVWTFRLKIESSDQEVDEDPEVFGRWECQEYGRGDRDRPADFTGAAVKIQHRGAQGYYFWYEPPKDMRRFKGSGFATVEDWEKAKAANLQHVTNLLSYGYIDVAVEITHKLASGYERVESDSLGGVESDIGLHGEDLKNHREYVAEIVKELIGEALVHFEEVTV